MVHGRDMDLTLFIVLFCIVASLGGRAQRTTAVLKRELGARGSLLAIVLVTAAAASAAMGYLGAALADPLIGLSRAMLIAAGLVAAATGLLLPTRAPETKEPTRSLGAITLALFWHQLFDPPRWIAFSVALALVQPEFAALSVWAGSAAGLIAAWCFPALTGKDRLIRNLHWLAGVMALLAAGTLVWIGINFGA